MSPLKLRSMRRTVSPSSHLERGFTLVELLVTIGIIGILIGLLFPALSAVRNAARKSYCASNMRQMILATLSYESTHLVFPAGDNGEGGSFIISLLPYFKQEYLTQLEQADLAAGEEYHDRLRQMADTEVEVLICPASYTVDNQANIENTGGFTTHYYGVCGPTGTGAASDGSIIYNYDNFSPISPHGPIGLQGLFSPLESGKFAGRKLKDIRDGESYTFAIGEVSGYAPDSGLSTAPFAGWSFGAEYRGQGRPYKTFALKSMAYAINSHEGDINNFSFSSNHPGGAQFCFVDGAVRYVDAKVPLDILKTFCSVDEVEKPEQLKEF